MPKQTKQMSTPEARRKANETRRLNAPILMAARPFELLKHKTHIKARILFEQDGKCLICKCEPTWLGKPLNFHLDHIDGDNKHNARSNLRMLCPNCHSQTETYCGRNKGKYTAGVA